MPPWAFMPTHSTPRARSGGAQQRQVVKCQDIVWEWFAKHYRCYGTRTAHAESEGGACESVL